MPTRIMSCAKFFRYAYSIRFIFVYTIPYSCLYMVFNSLNNLHVAYSLFKSLHIYGNLFFVHYQSYIIKNTALRRRGISSSDFFSYLFFSNMNFCKGIPKNIKTNSSYIQDLHTCLPICEIEFFCLFR